MMRACKVLAPRSFPETAVVDRVVLDYEDRRRRPLATEGVEGTALLLDLAEAAPLVADAGLELEDGRVVLVVAAAEPLLEIRAADLDRLARIAWHLGNRHLPMQVVGTRLRIRRDREIEDMAHGLGARVVPIEAPFDPEGGHPAAVTSRDVLAVRSEGHVHDETCGCGHHHHDHGHHHGHGHHDHGHHDHGHHDHGHSGHGHKHG